MLEVMLQDTNPSAHSETSLSGSGTSDASGAPPSNLPGTAQGLRRDLIAARVILGAALVGLVLVLGDKRADAILSKLAWCLILWFVGLKLWPERSAASSHATLEGEIGVTPRVGVYKWWEILKERFWSSDKRRSVVVFVATTAMGMGLAIAGGAPIREAIAGWLRYGIWLLWPCAVYAFFTWVSSSARGDSSPTGCSAPEGPPIVETQRGLRFLRFSGCALAMYAVLVYLACFRSPYPRTAWKLFAYELAPLVALYFFAIEVFPKTLTHRALVRYLRRVLVGVALILGISVLAMAAVGTLHRLGLLPSTVYGYDGWIRVEPQNPSAAPHLQFPFTHHNRASFYAMSAMFLLTALGATLIGLRLYIWGSALLAFVALIYGLTRGALIGAAIGVATLWLGAISYWRGKAVWTVALLLLLGAAGWGLLPQSGRERLRDALELKAYRPGTETSVGARLLIQSATIAAVGQRPILGWGYGYEVFERVSANLFPEMKRTTEGMSHSHNQWLEIAFESGVVSAGAFFAFVFFRIAVLGMALRATRGAVFVTVLTFLALELAIQIYGLTNYTLRRNLAYYTYAIWIASHIVAWSALSQREKRATETQPPAL